jgi:hypothetical protein
MSAAGQRATAARLKAEQEAADPAFGTRDSRIKVVQFHGRKADPISDSRVDANDIVEADPSRNKPGVGEGGRSGFVLDGKVKETAATGRSRWSEAIAEQTALDQAAL